MRRGRPLRRPDGAGGTTGGRTCPRCRLRRGQLAARPVTEGRCDALARVRLVPEPVAVRKVSAALVVRTCVHLRAAEQVVPHVCLLVILRHAVGSLDVWRPYDHPVAPALSPALLWRRGRELNACLAPRYACMPCPCTRTLYIRSGPAQGVHDLVRLASRPRACSAFPVVDLRDPWIPFALSCTRTSSPKTGCKIGGAALTYRLPHTLVMKMGAATRMEMCVNARQSKRGQVILKSTKCINSRNATTRNKPETPSVCILLPNARW